ncbi:MAG: twin-arginine translocase subunit TatC [Myxococcales bacterium]|nr:twin-arginine translocase subunit TatC [Myxococcales bacterium]
MATADPDAELDEGRMPFLEHLREFRDRLRNAAICFMVATIVCWFFARDIYAELRVPLDQAMAHYPQFASIKMKYNVLTEPFWVYMSVALWAGVFVASPLIFYQLWKFIAPGLYKHERRIGVVFATFSGLFFVGGALFCHQFVLEPMFQYLLGVTGEDAEPALTMTGYLDLTRDMMLAFGAVFEMPFVIYFLAKIGLVTHKSLWRFNRWFVVLAFIIGAILTPSADVVSQCLMALPMIALYNLSIIVAWVVVRNKERAAKAAGYTEAPPDDDDEA